jgi:hypothetical protein
MTLKSYDVNIMVVVAGELLIAVEQGGRCIVLPAAPSSRAVEAFTVAM